MQNPTTGFHSPPKGGQTVPVATSSSTSVYIRVRLATVLQIPTPPTNPSPGSQLEQSPGHLYLIEGTFADISRYAGATVDWIIKVAHLICDPLGTGQVFTHTTGTSSEWYASDRAASWQQVVIGDPLLPGIYEFEPASPIVLSKISERHDRSLTTPGSESNSSTFRRNITQRDTACIVTRSPNSLVASHLIPKRMGSDGAREVVARFAGAHEANGIHRYDAKIGILLLSTLNGLVDHYRLGFYHDVMNTQNNTYTLHNFYPDWPDLSIVGAALPTLPNINLPLLHRHSVTLSVHGGDEPLPPQGVFDWHYLQCVIHRFGTPQYRGFPNIRYFTYPIKTASDSSDDESIIDDDANPPWPTYHFDQYLEQQRRTYWAHERRKELLHWAAGVPSGIY